MIVLLRGRFDFLIFDPQAELVQRLAMSAAAPVAQIPPGTWHGGVALAPQTMVLEVKPGPYRPNEFAAWAPEEVSLQAAHSCIGPRVRAWEANGAPRPLSDAMRARAPSRLVRRTTRGGAPSMRRSADHGNFAQEWPSE
jgi:hypothetical protein